MLALKVNDTWLNLSPSQSVSFTSICPVFDREKLDRFVSLPFRIDATPQNLAVLGPFNRIDADLTQSHQAALYLHDCLFEQGVLRLVAPGMFTGEFVFQSQSLFLGERLERIRMRDFNMPVTVAEPYRPTLLLNAFRTVLTFSITLGINDRIFTAPADDLDSIVDQVNAVWPGIASVFLSAPDNQQMLLQVVDEPSQFLIRAAPDVPDPSSHAFFFVADSTYEVETERISDAWADVLATPRPAGAAFPITYVPNLYAEKNVAFQQFANYTDLDGVHPNDAVTPFTATGWAHTILPFPRVLEVIQTIAEGAGILLDDDFFNDAELADLCFWSNLTLDVVRSAKEYQEGGPVTNPVHTYPASYDVTRHLPDISVREMFIRLANTFCLFLFERNGALSIVPCAPLLNAAPRDWTLYAVPQYRGRYDTRKGYTLDYDRQNDETNILGQLQRVNGGDEADTYRPGFYTLHDVTVADPLSITRAFRVPLINEQATVPFFGISRTPSLRLIFDRGQQPDSLGTSSYSFASHSTRNFFNETVGDYSLDWQGPDGLYSQWWAAFIEALRRNERITIPMRLPIAELLELRQWRQVKVSIYTEAGSVVGIIERVQFSVSVNEGVSISQVTLLKT